MLNRKTKAACSEDALEHAVSDNAEKMLDVITRDNRDPVRDPVCDGVPIKHNKALLWNAYIYLGLSKIISETSALQTGMAEFELAKKLLPDKQMDPALFSPKIIGYYTTKYVAVRRSASQLYKLGLDYEIGRSDLQKNKKTAVGYYLAAAEQGHAGAQNRLGMMYEFGHGGLHKSDQPAVEYFQRAAEQGYAKAQANLGYMYARGRGGLPRNRVKAVALYKAAVAQGSDVGQNNLGAMYNKGLGGLPKNPRRAVELFSLSAKQGFGLAPASRVEVVVADPHWVRYRRESYRPTSFSMG